MVREVKGIEKMSMLGAGRGARERGRRLEVEVNSKRRSPSHDLSNLVLETVEESCAFGAFKFRRGQYFWHTRAAVGHATALAVSRRARLSERALRRNRPNRHTSDDLLYPPTAPVAF